MVSTIPEIVFYTSKICPWAARTWLALEVAGAKYEYKEVDLQNKPDWFLKVSTKVPALTLDGEILIESAITTRYIAELYPEAGLISNDPLLNAKSLLWADRYQELILPNVFYPLLRGSSNATEEEIEAGFFEYLDKVIPYLKNENGGPYAAGSQKPLLGDLYIAPFIGRVHLFIEKGVLPKSISAKLSTDPKYAAYLKYVQTIHELPAFQKTFKGEVIFEHFQKRIAAAKAAAK